MACYECEGVSCPTCKRCRDGVCVNKTDGSDCGNCKKCYGGSCNYTCRSEACQTCINDWCEVCDGEPMQSCCDGTCFTWPENKCCDDIGGIGDGYSCAANKTCCKGECCDPGKSCCDGTCYNPLTQGCCEGLTIYDKATEKCCNDGLGNTCPKYFTCCDGDCCDDLDENCCNGTCCSKDDCCIDGTCVTDTCFTTTTIYGSTDTCPDCEDISGPSCGGTQREQEDYDVCVTLPAGGGTSGYCDCDEEEQVVGYYYDCKINWDCSHMLDCAKDIVECALTCVAGVCLKSKTKILQCISCIRENSVECTDACGFVEKCEKDDDNKAPIRRDVFTNFGSSSCKG